MSWLTGDVHIEKEKKSVINGQFEPTHVFYLRGHSLDKNIKYELGVPGAARGMLCATFCFGLRKMSVQKEIVFPPARSSQNDKFQPSLIELKPIL